MPMTIQVETDHQELRDAVRDPCNRFDGAD